MRDNLIVYLFYMISWNQTRRRMAEWKTPNMEAGDGPIARSRRERRAVAEHEEELENEELLAADHFDWLQGQKDML